MTELEESMKFAVKAAVYDCTLDYVKTPRIAWMQAWQMQCVLTASQVHWTREVEVYIEFF